MDAVTLVAAAVAIAVDHSRNAALEDCLLDRERQAMRAADLESLLAQRTFLSSRPLPRRGAIEARHRESLLAAWAAESDSDNSDAEPVVQIAPQPALDLQLVQRCGRCWSTRHLEVLPPTGRWANLPMEQRLFCERCIDALQPVQRCGRCASTRNLELLLPTGRWANLPMEERLFCDRCIVAAAES